MSYIRDAMEKAEMLSKSATTSAVQEIPSPSTKEPIRANKTNLSILCLCEYNERQQKKQNKQDEQDEVMQWWLKYD
jgi:hypothetical protein